MKTVWIVDFGSQYTQLITRKSRMLGHACEIITLEDCLNRLQKNELPLGFILSGGPDSIFEDQQDYAEIFKTELPLLGICYGMQLIAHYYGGVVERGIQGEYGHSMVTFTKGHMLKNMPERFSVWMSHFDHLTIAPKDFQVTLKSENGLIAGIENKEKAIIGLQFHPEVEHTDHGLDILQHFFEDVAKLKPNWTDETLEEQCLSVVKKAKDSTVLCAFSGGVDSLVAAYLAHRVLGKKLYCFFVDHGLLRPQDLHHIEVLKKQTELQIEVINVQELFLNQLEGITSPEEKRKIIGKSFIEVFEQKVHAYEKDHNIHFDYLLQGTLYPDVIESIAPHKKGGKSVTIKSHHNVGGLPERMKLKLLEPLRFLFKDEVRKLGELLGLSHEWLYRHPFPGPGIGVRVLGEIKRESIVKVQKSDQILFEELKAQHLYDACWQAFTVLLPVQTVGVKGDARAYEEVICLRIVNSTDGMTAKWTELPYSFLAKVSSRITNEVAGVTRVVYDITSKPPGTIEWE